MPQNIELKARLSDLVAARHTAARVGAAHHGVLEQTDTYFRVPHGRLKLRQFRSGPAELIYYERRNADAPRPSTYERTPISDPAALCLVLEQALGIVTVVSKRRELWLLDNVRIHLDEVAGLGQFLEFEAIVDARHTAVIGQDQVEKLAGAFALTRTDLVAESYCDMALQLLRPPAT